MESSKVVNLNHWLLKGVVHNWKIRIGFYTFETVSFLVSIWFFGAVGTFPKCDCLGKPNIIKERGTSQTIRNYTMLVLLFWNILLSWLLFIIFQHSNNCSFYSWSNAVVEQWAVKFFVGSNDGWSVGYSW